MKKLGLEILKRIYNYGYNAYIIGGFVRDELLGIETNDIDITTNATPMELKNIFPNIELSSTSYGSVRIIYEGTRFDITTFREEDNYLDNRHPSNVHYVNDLKTDLLRRDFTINTLCIDKDGNLVDLLNARDDLDKHILKTIVDSNTSFSRDALRILRAIRFASSLNFELSPEIALAINKNKDLLKKLSYERKREELDKIFGSNKAKEGIELIKKFHLEESLELPNLERVKDYSDIVGIWAMINPSNYRFSNNEKELIEKINLVYDMDNLDNCVLYEYGLYVNVIAGINKGINKKDILEKYDSLPIKNRNDICIKADDICNLLNKRAGSFIGKIYKDLEIMILTGKIENDRLEIMEYIKNRGES